MPVEHLGSRFEKSRDYPPTNSASYEERVVIIVVAETTPPHLGRANIIYGGKCAARGRGSWKKNGRVEGWHCASDDGRTPLQKCEMGGVVSATTMMTTRSS